MGFVRLGALLLAMPGLAFAQDAQSALEGLPAATVKRLQSSPDRVEQAAALLMAGSGDGDRISAAQVEAEVDLRLAYARAGTLARLLAADLDNDGIVSAQELAALGRSSGSRNRGWLGVAGRDADRDGDGDLDPAELRLYAQGQAEAEVPDREIAQIRGVMQFDLDDDQVVTLAELRQVIKAAGQMPAPEEPAKPGG